MIFHKFISKNLGLTFPRNDVIMDNGVTLQGGKCFMSAGTLGGLGRVAVETLL